MEKRVVNFIEAINSGKRFKCVTYNSNDFNGCFCDKYISGQKFLEELNEFNFHVLKLLINSQFELEEKTITITEHKFDTVFHNYLASDNCGISQLKKELGF